MHKDGVKRVRDSGGVNKLIMQKNGSTAGENSRNFRIEGGKASAHAGIYIFEENKINELFFTIKH